jgi:hypothetical protein
MTTFSPQNLSLILDSLKVHIDDDDDVYFIELHHDSGLSISIQTTQNGISPE